MSPEIQIPGTLSVTRSEARPSGVPAGERLKNCTAMLLERAIAICLVIAGRNRELTLRAWICCGPSLQECGVARAGRRCHANAGAPPGTLEVPIPLPEVLCGRQTSTRDVPPSHEFKSCKVNQLPIASLAGEFLDTEHRRVALQQRCGPCSQ